MGTKINENIWGEVPATGGTLRVNRSLRDLIADNLYNPETGNFDMSISPWGIGYSNAGNFSIPWYTRTGQAASESNNRISKIGREDSKSYNTPFLMGYGIYGQRENYTEEYTRPMQRIYGGTTKDNNNYIVSTVKYDLGDKPPSSHVSASDSVANLKPVLYLDYQSIKVVSTAIHWINLINGTITRTTFANPTQYNSYVSAVNSMDLENIGIIAIEYQIYVKTNGTWGAITSDNSYMIHNFKKFKVTDRLRQFYFSGDETDYVPIMPRQYIGATYRDASWTSNGGRCIPMESYSYGALASYHDFDNLFDWTNFAGKSGGRYTIGSWSFEDNDYSTEVLSFWGGTNPIREVHENDIISYSGYIRTCPVTKITRTNAPRNSTAINTVICHELAFLGLPFVNGWSTNYANQNIGDADVYLPVFDDHMITTGRYVRGADALNLPNALWGNVFDDTMPNYDPDYDPRPQPGTSDMTIGGSQTNYPNGFTNHNNGGVYNGTDGNAMYQGNNALRGTVENAIALSMSGKIYCIDGQMLSQAINALNNNSLIQAAARSTIQEIYGANVYDGITLCRMYPFNLEGSAYAQVPYVYGVYPLLELENGVPKPGQYYFWICNKYAYQFDMGYVIPPIQQAWEIENIEYSIYLPFAGTYPIDIRSSEIIRVYLNVDVFSGLGEYIIYQGAQVTHSFKVNLGWDIPINLSRGEMLQNLYTTTQNAIAKTIGVGSTALGVATGNPIAGMAGTMVAQGMVNSEHWAVTAPQIGGIAGLFSYPKARLICKIPKMFKDAYGYNELLGANRSTGYEALNSCSGFVKCKNYKCDIIVATSDEKAEIERLMDAGVFV